MRIDGQCSRTATAQKGEGGIPQSLLVYNFVDVVLRSLCAGRDDHFTSVEYSYQQADFAPTVVSQIVGLPGKSRS